MSNLDTLTARAAKAAETLREAQGAHEAAVAAAKRRNRATGTAYWQDMNARVLPGRVQDMQDARAAFSEAVRTAGDAVAAYGAYVAAHGRWKGTNNAVANGLVIYVSDLTGEPHADPEERWGRVTYPAGVQPPAPHGPDAFLSMLEAATKDASAAHERDTATELHAALAVDLEPEGDD